MEHLVRYGKSYSSKEELARRFELFKRNFEMVKAHNARAGVMYKMGLNSLSDMAPEEFPSHSAVDLAETEDTEATERFMLQQNVNVTDVDWRNTTFLNPARSQGSCNANWAFVSAMTMESANALLQNKEVRMTAVSIQQQVDCDITNQGCFGGWPTRNYQYVVKYGYVNPLNYPYEYIGVQRSCYPQPSSNVIKFPFMRPRQYYTITSKLLAYYT